MPTRMNISISEADKLDKTRNGVTPQKLIRTISSLFFFFASDFMSLHDYFSHLITYTKHKTILLIYLQQNSPREYPTYQPDVPCPSVEPLLTVCLPELPPLVVVVTCHVPALPPDPTYSVKGEISGNERND